jgi:hypothetical protein
MPVSYFKSAVDAHFTLDDEQVSATERDAAISSALAVYGENFPREVVEDVAAADIDTLPLPEAWESGFSVLLSAEYPVGSKPPQLLDLDFIYEYRAPSVPNVLNHVSNQFTTGDSVRLTYTARHVLDAENDSVPLSHRNAIVLMAVCQLCSTLAVRFSADSSSTIGADSVDQQSKGRNYAAMAKQFCAQARNELGLPAHGTGNALGAAMGVTDWDMYTQRGRDRLYHPGRWR